MVDYYFDVGSLVDFIVFKRFCFCGNCCFFFYFLVCYFNIYRSDINIVCSCGNF